MKKMLLGMGLIAMLGMSGFVYAKATQPANDAVLDARVQIAKLRGKLVYKKGQIRKLERSACEKNAELKAKVDKLEEERRASYLAVEPKLKTLYAEQDAIDAEIKKGYPTGEAAE